MEKLKWYKIAIFILSLLVIIQAALLLNLWRRKIPKKPLVTKGKIAIVLDDWGYNENNLDILKEIQCPMTMSILPNLPYSTDLAEKLKVMGFEVILHLPMEPVEKYKLEQNTIMTDMDETTIQNIISIALESVPTAKGVSNHMGSKATADLRTMSIVLKELEKRGLYFLDSFVASNSVCKNLTRKMRIGFASRDIFIDNQSDPEYIKGQIYKLKKRARIYGRAIGIGHDRRNTLEVLKQVIPELEREGYELVFVSGLIRRS